MADLKPIGSEKLPLDKKLQRIMEIANYGITKKTKDHKTASLEYSIKAADGNRYGIIRENSQYLILKEGSKGFTYLNGMRNNSRYTFNSYAEALKKLNLLMKPINESYNNGRQLNLIGEQEEEEDKKFVLKQPKSEEDDMDLSISDTMDLGTGDEELDVDTDFDMGADTEIEMDTEVEGEMSEDDDDATKAIQKLTGKLGQKLRELSEPEMTADIIKYVLNSVISAVDLEKLTTDDRDEIVSKFEDEDVDYTEEGEFDVDLSGEEELDMGDEELDLETELAEEMMGDYEEETNENLGALARMAVGAAATGFGQRAADRVFKEEKEMDENAFVLAADEARDKGKKVFEFPKGSGKMHPVTIKTDIDVNEEDTLNFSGEVEDVEAIDAVADIFNESFVGKTLKKYFELTPREKKQKRLQEQKRKQRINSFKDNFLKESVNQIKRNRLLESSFSSYEQEITTKNFLKENREFNFIGKNKRGGLVFKRNNNLVEISTTGRII